MGIKINTTVTGSFSRESKGEGTGPRGGRIVFEDTGRTMIGIATDMASKTMSEETLQNMGNVMVEEVRMVTPVETEALINSIRATVGASDKGKSQVRVLAGGPDAPVPPTKNAPTGIVDYAVKVHETIIPYMTIGMANARKLMEDELVKGAKKATKGGKGK